MIAIKSCRYEVLEVCMHSSSQDAHWLNRTSFLICTLLQNMCVWLYYNHHNALNHYVTGTWKKGSPCAITDPLIHAMQRFFVTMYCPLRHQCSGCLLRLWLCVCGSSCYLWRSICALQLYSLVLTSSCRESIANLPRNNAPSIVVIFLHSITQFLYLFGLSVSVCQRSY